MADDGLVAKIARVTARIAPATTGEVVVPAGGGQTYYAYAFDADAQIEVDTEVMVVEHIGPRAVKVVPLTETGERPA
jgi:hypothetical protein